VILKKKNTIKNLPEKWEVQYFNSDNLLIRGLSVTHLWVLCVPQWFFTGQ